ncbi:MAG: hypothetical protein K5770_10915 [Lachnospiraceae bacterium]|nr:hypothetical protein [Lachnospiraceae bacterium]
MSGGTKDKSIREQYNTIVFQETMLKGTDTDLLHEFGKDRLGQPVSNEEYGRQERLFPAEDADSLLTVVARQAANYQNGELSETELQKKKLDMMDAMLGFEVLSIDKEAKEKVEDNRRAKAEQYADIPRTLYSTSREQRTRVLKSLKLDEKVKKQLAREEKGMEEILHNYVSEKEQHRIAKEGKNFLKVFRRAKEELNKNHLLSAEEKANRLYRLAKPFEAAIVMYKDEYFTTLEKSNRQKGIEELLDRITQFYDLYAEENTNEVMEQSRKKADLLKKLEITEEQNSGSGIEKSELAKRVRNRARKIDKSEEKRSDVSLDENLSAEQIAGVSAVDRFLAGQAGEGCNIAFLDKLFRLTLRDRLLLYGLVEKGREAAPNATDIAITQISYVPDPVALEKKLRSLPGFLWGGDKRKWIGRHIRSVHWEKLEAALGYLGQSDVTDVRDAFAKLQGTGPAEKEQEQETVDTLAQAREQGKIEADGVMSPMMLTKLITDNEAARDRQLLVTIDALEKCRDAMEAAEKSHFHKKAKKEAADSAANIAKNEIKKLEELDRELYNTIRDVKKKLGAEGADISAPETESKVDEAINTKPAAEGLAKQIVGGTITYGSQATLLLSKLNKVATLINGESGTAIGITSGAFASVTGVMGLIGGALAAVKTIRAIHDNGSSIAKTDVANMISKTTRSIGGSAWGIAAGGYQIGLVAAGQTAKAMGDAATNALNSGLIEQAKALGEAAQTMGDKIGVATNVLTGLNVAVSGLKIAVDVGDAAVQAKHAVHHSVATYRVYKLEKKGGLKGDDAAYADNILKVDRRNKANAAIETANSIAINSAAIVTTLFAGPAGAIAFAGFQVANTILMKALMKIRKKEDLMEMVDEFLQLESVTRQAFSNYNEMSFREKNRAMQDVREEMMAELGFVSDTAFAKHIAGNYAGFIYQNLFFKNELEEKKEKDNDLDQGDNDTAPAVVLQNKKVPFLEEDNENNRLSDMSLACYQMVKSLGLKVRFPKNPGDDRYPTPQMIAAKLMG